MSHGVPIGNTSTNAHITISNSSVVISHINTQAINDSLSAYVTIFQGAPVVGNKVGISTISAGDPSNLDVWEEGLLCQNGCQVTTSSNISWANIGYRTYAG